MKTLVIYKSKTGFVRKYANWIADELSADLYEASKVTPDLFTEYDVIIYGGGLYAAGINGVTLITDNLAKLKGKKVAVFATGVAPSKDEVISEVKNKNFTFEQQQFIRLFYLRGGFDYSKLKIADKVMMTLLKRKIKRKSKESLTADEKGMLSAYGKPVDFSREQNIQGIVTYITSYITS